MRLYVDVLQRTSLMNGRTGVAWSIPVPSIRRYGSLGEHLAAPSLKTTLIIPGICSRDAVIRWGLAGSRSRVSVRAEAVRGFRVGHGGLNQRGDDPDAQHDETDHLHKKPDNCAPKQHAAGN